MKHILMLCGYSAYQAGCIAPWLWVLAAALGVYAVVHCTAWIWEDSNDR